MANDWIVKRPHISRRALSQNASDTPCLEHEMGSHIQGSDKDKSRRILFILREAAITWLKLHPKQWVSPVLFLSYQATRSPKEVGNTALELIWQPFSRVMNSFRLSHAAPAA